MTKSLKKGVQLISKFLMKDFRCHDDYLEINIPGLTIISGTNNSGKSSILQAIYLLSQNKIKTHPILALNDAMDKGSFSDILHKSNPKKETVEFDIDFDGNILAKSELETLSVTFIYQNSAVIENLADTYTDTPILTLMEIQYSQKGEALQDLSFSLVEEKDNVFYRVDSATDKGYCKMQGIVPDPVIYENLEGKNRKICSLAFDTIRVYLSLLTTEKIKYLKDTRLFDFIDIDTHVDMCLSAAGEYTSEIIYKSWDKTIDFKKEVGGNFKFSELFDQWIEKLLGSEYKVRSESTDSHDRRYRITIAEDMQQEKTLPEKHLELNLKHVGVGISRVLKIITMILTSKKNDILLVENPEVHLHPKLQAELLDIFLFAVDNGRRLVVETHSDHVINRLRCRVKQTPELLYKTGILFLEKTRGIVRSTEIHIDENGGIDFWPENFFDQAYKDMLELITK